MEKEIQKTVTKIIESQDIGELHRETGIELDGNELRRYIDVVVREVKKMTNVLLHRRKRTQDKIAEDSDDASGSSGSGSGSGSSDHDDGSNDDNDDDNSIEEPDSVNPPLATIMPEPKEQPQLEPSDGNEPEPQ
jgi:hypothetical protein